MSTLRSLFHCIPICLALGFPIHCLSGEVVHVSDGDTLTVVSEGGHRFKVRIAGIDAPEKGQAFGNKSRVNLASLTQGNVVRLEGNKKDKYGRRVAKVFVADTDIGLMQVEAGLAWHFKKYESEQSEKDRVAYEDAEARAKSRGIGLWSMKCPIAPWDYRQGIRNPGEGCSAQSD